VNFSRVLSLGALALVLTVTTVPKLREFTAAPRKLSENLEQASAAVLVREGFKVNIGYRFGAFVIDAQANECRLQIREAAAEGFNAEVIKENVPKDAHLVFVFRGKLWMSHPTLRATISEIWDRVKWKLGVASSWSPVISVAAIGSCPLETLPWSNLASIQAN
jgi:hypothetical protein